MRKALFPALALFGAAALGLVALRGTMNERTEVQPAMAEAPERIASEPRVKAQQIRMASLRKEGDGHYWATARVNGASVKFLVDTGATLVALNKRDARRVGLDLENLQMNIEVRTASGRVQARGAVLDTMEIDGVNVEDVSAVVIEEGLEYSLLGMSFLNRLEAWDVTPNAIIIHE